MKITPRNAQEMASKQELTGRDYITDSQARAWMVVYAYCKQEKMKFRKGSGVENVVNFISKKIKKAKR